MIIKHRKFMIYDLFIHTYIYIYISKVLDYRINNEL